MVFLEELFKMLILKKINRRQNSTKYLPGGKKLKPLHVILALMTYAAVKAQMTFATVQFGNAMHNWMDKIHCHFDAILMLFIVIFEENIM